MFTRAPQFVAELGPALTPVGSSVARFVFLGYGITNTSMPSLARFGLDTLRHAGANQCGASSSTPIRGFGHERDRDPRALRRYQTIENISAGRATRGRRRT
jgi:hypothetical protein